MRILALIPLALLTTACWTPGPGQVDPTRYPWDPRNVAALAPPAPQPRIEARGKIAPSPEWQPTQQQPHTSESSYCVMAIEQERQTGITLSANVGVMACSVAPNAAPAKTERGPPPSS